jgi:hypothetical protein
MRADWDDAHLGPVIGLVTYRPERSRFDLFQRTFRPSQQTIELGIVSPNPNINRPTLDLSCSCLETEQFLYPTKAKEYRSVAPRKPMLTAPVTSEKET